MRRVVLMLNIIYFLQIKYLRDSEWDSLPLTSDIQLKVGETGILHSRHWSRLTSWHSLPFLCVCFIMPLNIDRRQFRAHKGETVDGLRQERSSFIHRRIRSWIHFVHAVNGFHYMAGQWRIQCRCHIKPQFLPSRYDL